MMLVASRMPTTAPRAPECAALAWIFHRPTRPEPGLCLRRGQVEIPSDFGGVVYETFDASGGWKSALGRELEAAGFEVDWNKVMRP